MMQNRILLHQKRKWLLKFIYIDCCIARYVIVVVVVVVVGCENSDLCTVNIVR